jgi:hypothetical protein
MTRPVRRLTGLLFLLLVVVGASIALLNSGIYGNTLFVLAPLLASGVASWTFQPRSGKDAALLGTMTGLCGSLLLLGLRMEGAVCILMSLPLTLPFGALGGWLAWRLSGSPQIAGAAMLLLVPGSLWVDTAAHPPAFEVRSSVEINAAPEQVWKRVIAFPELPPPDEWYFRAGIAYPIRARIVGTGPGAVRYCEFSTGPFVEPIETWDEPHLLRFRVTANPEPMREWTPYGNAEPKHLHGYLVSKQGQFRLIGLPGNRTLLEGTTWYQHGLWPSQYWRLWSDAIIHRIHLRVLNQIRTLAEADARRQYRSDFILPKAPHGLFRAAGRASADRPATEARRISRTNVRPVHPSHQSQAQRLQLPVPPQVPVRPPHRAGPRPILSPVLRAILRAGQGETLELRTARAPLSPSAEFSGRQARRD